jgi:hypothetical protein
MIALTPDHHDELKRVANAGTDGLPLAELNPSAVITLGTYEFVTITREPDQRVTATPKGAAHSRRTTFA